MTAVLQNCAPCGRHACAACGSRSRVVAKEYMRPTNDHADDDDDDDDAVDGATAGFTHIHTHRESVPLFSFTSAALPWR